MYTSGPVCSYSCNSCSRRWVALCAEQTRIWQLISSALSVLAAACAWARSDLLPMMMIICDGIEYYLHKGDASVPTPLHTSPAPTMLLSRDGRYLAGSAFLRIRYEQGRRRLALLLLEALLPGLPPLTPRPPPWPTFLL